MESVENPEAFGSSAPAPRSKAQVRHERTKAALTQALEALRELDED